MRPDHDQRDGLPHADCRRGDPQRAHHIFVGVPDIEQLVKQPRADDMLGDEQRDQQAENDLRRFARRHDQRAAAIERDQRQHEMDEQRTVEQDVAGGLRQTRKKDVPARLGRLERDQIERVIGQMRDHEQYQHQPRGEPRIAQQALRNSMVLRQGAVRECRSFRIMPAVSSRVNGAVLMNPLSRKFRNGG